MKLADKICNLRDMATSPPWGWPNQRRREYFEWSKEVIEQVRGVSPKLEAAFDQAYSARI